MSDDKTTYSIRSYGSQFRVIENSTGLILRTLATRDEATAFAGALVEDRRKK